MNLKKGADDFEGQTTNNFEGQTTNICSQKKKKRCVDGIPKEEDGEDGDNDNDAVRGLALPPSSLSSVQRGSSSLFMFPA